MAEATRQTDSASSLVDASSPVLRTVRTLEFGLLFFGLPSLAAFGPFQIRVIPTLVAVGLICAAALLLDRSFDRRSLLRPSAVWVAMRWIIARFVILGVLLLGATWIWDLMIEPSVLFALPRRDAGLWLTIMVLYPLFSVYPQELIYRAFVFQRYAPAFGERWGMVAASALAFGYGHIIFGHWLSVAMTVLAGALFAHTYAKRRSLAACWLEHTLYGDLVFTIGLGSLFYLAPSAAG